MSHQDGSGEIAIKMIHRDSKTTICMDVTRLVGSIALLIFSTISVLYAMSVQGTTMPHIFPAYVQMLLLLVSLTGLAVLEGLQIAVVELAHNDHRSYERVYPRAARLLKFENQGRNVERFLMGRQVLVVFFVFIAARITTFHQFWADVPDEFIHSVMYSGFLGVILVVIVAQLTPQVLAAAYPIEFLNLPLMKYAFWACLLVEASGIVHAVWFLCVTVKKLFYRCVCPQHKNNKKFDFSSSSIEMGRTDNVNMNTSEMQEREERVATPNPPMLNIAKKAEKEAIKTIIEQKVEPAWTNCEQDSLLVGTEVNSLIKSAEHNRDLFYIYGSEKFASPAQCQRKFEKCGLPTPQFLLPPDHSDHIPPHIVALTMLKLYTEKNTPVDL